MTRRAVREALGNPLILQKVLKNVGTYDLLHCRLVTFTNWCDLSTEILSRRKNLQVSFTHLYVQPLAHDDEYEGTINVDSNKESVKKSGFFSVSTENLLPLSSFTEFLINTSRFPFSFPCRRFQFSDGFIEDNEDFAHFIEVYGGQIVDLEVDLRGRKATNRVIETLGQVLVQLTNLEELTIGQLSLGWSTESHLFFPRDFQMPKLTSVRIGSNICDDLNFFNDLRLAAPNLKNVKRFSLPYSKSEVEEWIGRRERGAYNFLNFDLKAYEIDFYEHLARSRPKFETIAIHLKPVKEGRLLTRVTSTLTKFFRDSRNTLKQIHNIEQLDLLPNFQIPPLTQVKFLDIDVNERFWNQGIDGDANFENLEVFPTTHFDFPVTFPNLSSLRFRGPSMDIIETVVANNLSKFDPVDLKFNCTPTTTVTNLEITVDCPKFFPTLIPQLGQIFPMVQQLHIVYLQKVSELAPELWTSFPKLVNLFAIISTDEVCTSSMVQKVVYSLRDHCSGPKSEIRTLLDNEIDFKMGITRKLHTNPVTFNSSELQTVRLEFHSTCVEGRRLFFKSDCVGQLVLEEEKLLRRCKKGLCMHYACKSWKVESNLA